MECIRLVSLTQIDNTFFTSESGLKLAGLKLCHVTQSVYTKIIVKQSKLVIG